MEAMAHLYIYIDDCPFWKLLIFCNYVKLPEGNLEYI